MKNIVVLSVLIVLFLFSKGQVLEVSSDGEYRLVKEGKSWTKTDIQVEPGTERYLYYFSQAIESPGEFIEIFESKELAKITGFFEVLVNKTKGGIIYNADKGKISFLEKSLKEEKRSSAPVFILLLVILIVLSDIFYNRNRKLFSKVALFTIGLGVVALFSFYDLSFFSFLFGLIALCSFLFGYLTSDSKKMFNYSFLVSCLSMATCLVFLL